LRGAIQVEGAFVAGILRLRDWPGWGGCHPEV